MRYCIYYLLLFISSISFSQTQLSGKIIDEQNNPISGANIYLEGTYDGTSSNQEGDFSFNTLETGRQIIIVSFLSFETFRKEIEVSHFSNQTIKLKESVNALDAVILTAGTFDAGDKARVSVLKPLDIVTTAGSAGNIIGALTTLPGTNNVGEDGRLFVRGGEADETQTFVDGLRVAQPYGATTNNLPTRGRFSPFLFNGISFSTGGYSAEYGEALSSVLLLNTIDAPDQEKTEIALMTVGLGLGNTQKWKKNSFSVNLNYIDLSPYQAAVPQAFDWNRAFQSLSGEMVYRHDFKNGLLKTYFAFDASRFDLNQDDINQPEKVRIDLANDNLYFNTSYRGTFGNNWNVTTGMSYGFSQNKIGINNDDLKNQENAAHLKFKISKKFTERFKLNFGADYFHTVFDERFTPFQSDRLSTAYQNTIVASYVESDLFLSKKLAFKLGARLSNTNLLEDTRLAPRASFAYKVSQNAQISMAYGDFYQTPRQDYIKFTNNLQSEKASHYILNYQYSFKNRTFRAEAYYKDYNNLVKFDTNTAQFNSTYNNNGFGYAKGIDLFWRDNSSIKNLEYWVSYSYIDTERDYRNFPNQVTPNFVADHSLSIVTKKWIEQWKSQIGLTYTINSGRPYNNPNETQFMNGKTKGFQDLSFNWAYLVTQQKILYFSVSNIMGNNNVFGYQYANAPDLSGQFQRRAVGQPAARFFFVGFFWTISEKKTDNQLNNL